MCLNFKDVAWRCASHPVCDPLKGVFTPGNSDSSLALVQTKGKKIIHCSYFLPFWFLFTPHCLLWSEPAETTKMQSRENIRFICWLDVSLNVFPKLLFDWSERACRKIPTVLLEVNKDGSKMQQTAHCYYGETTVRVDSIPGHPLLNSLYIPLQAIYNFWEWSADAAGK